jgi:hypothetical protein
MNEREDGGPAFPLTSGAVASENAGFMMQGMALRDYFAAQIVGHLSVSPLRQETTISDDVFYAYKIADAMLKERAK